MVNSLTDPHLIAATATRLIDSNQQTGLPAIDAFRLSDGGREWTTSPPDAGPSEGLSYPLVGNGDVVFISHSSGSATELCRVAVGSQSWLCTGQDMNFFSLGEGGMLYVATGLGLEARRQSDLSLVWSAAPAWSPVISTAIDCSRDATGAPLQGRPGVVYGQMTFGEHRLSAVIVDSRGIDAPAPWPMFRHDPRNTANFDTPLSPFSCP